jgi:NAD(P)H-hydrate epimerase
MSGASYLAAKSALRSGAGVVVSACPESIYPILAVKHTCVMVRAMKATPAGGFAAGALEPILELSKRFDAVVIGPGLGREPTTQHLVHELVRRLTKKIVLDADGLFAYDKEIEKLNETDGDLVLTPHEGELTRLAPAIFMKLAGEDRQGMVRAALEKAPRIVLVLKGKNTLVGRNPGGSGGQAAPPPAAVETYVNDTGNAGMATAGSGDVLSGVIGALLASGLSTWDAARLGVRLHGRAGDLAAAAAGAPLMIATDILEAMPRAIAERLKAEEAP